MRIVYLAQLFELENEFDSDRHHFFCKKLVEAGHRVTVLTSNIHYKTGEQKYPVRFLRKYHLIRDGIEIFYLYSPKRIQGSYLKRILYYLTYVFLALPMIRLVKEADLIYTVSPSLTVAPLGYWFSKRLRAVYVLEIADVWPDVLVETGFLRTRWVIRFLKRIEMFCYRKAKTIIALTRGIQKNIQEKIEGSADKVVLITNGINADLFRRESSEDIGAGKIGGDDFPKDKFICMYLGAHSLYNALDTAMAAAFELKGEPQFHFVLIGGGDKKEDLMKRAASDGLSNIHFLQPVPRFKAPQYLQAADVFLLPNLKGEFYEMNLQNKFFDYLASGKPIVFAGSGESAKIIEQTGCGKIVDAEDGHAMAEAIRSLESAPQEERREMGEKGRDFVFTHYNRELLFRRLLDTLSSIAG